MAQVEAKKIIRQQHTRPSSAGCSKRKTLDTEHPNLYTCKAVFGEDEVTETFGIRELIWNPQVGMTINGERVILRGACFHHDNGVLGACTYPEAEERKMRILKEMDTMQSALHIILALRHFWMPVTGRGCWSWMNLWMCGIYTRRSMIM